MTPASSFPLALSTGDPGGVGPEISLRVALAFRHEERLALFGDAGWLEQRALALGLARTDCLRCESASDLAAPKGKIAFVDVGVRWDQAALAPRATASGGLAQLRALDHAIAAAASGRARAIVTAPMSKEAVNLAGFDFVGHTEHLAQAAKLADDDVTMLFLGPKLRVALVTTHVSIAKLPAEITSARVQRTIVHLAEALLRQADPSRGNKPLSLVVSGLNPHAGEAGLFGDEEPRVIVPAMRVAERHAAFTSGRVVLRGPVPAETVFRQAAAGTIDGVVAMFHDQATIASKLLDWGQAVNVTWGLPFVRTSVDHGVAYDAAVSGHVDEEGMASALRMAQRLTAQSV